jgi:hypothetical protein
MRALCWHGKGDVRVDTVPDPKIQHPRDAVVKITACAICGSDLHLLDGYQPTMESGDILGHENMGEVIELGSEVKNLKIGDRVVVPFTISCGQCWFCLKGSFRAATAPTPMRRWHKRRWASRQPAYSGSATCSAAMREAKRNIFESSWPTSARSRFRTASPTNRHFSFPTFSRLGIWQPLTRRSSPAIPLRFGDVALSGSSRSAPRCCWEQAVSSLSTMPERLAMAEAGRSGNHRFLENGRL